MAKMWNLRIFAQIKSVSILDNSIPGLDFIVNTAGFSAVIEHIGDINQDGYVAVGIPYYRESYSDRGGAVVIFHLGEDGNSILNSFLIDGDTPNMPDIDTYAENQPVIPSPFRSPMFAIERPNVAPGLGSTGPFVIVLSIIE